jgi:hypothetical protein
MDQETSYTISLTLGTDMERMGITEVPGNRLFGVHLAGGINDGGTIYGIEKDGTGLYCITFC